MTFKIIGFLVVCLISVGAQFWMKKLEGEFLPGYLAYTIVCLIIGALWIFIT